MIAAGTGLVWICWVTFAHVAASCERLHAVNQEMGLGQRRWAVGNCGAETAVAHASKLNLVVAGSLSVRVIRSISMLW